MAITFRFYSGDCISIFCQSTIDHSVFHLPKFGKMKLSCSDEIWGKVITDSNTLPQLAFLENGAFKLLAIIVVDGSNSYS